MRIISWNLNHRTTMKDIPSHVLTIIGAIGPDLVVLNEYVDGPNRESFKDGLRSLGFENISTSEKIGRSNQVLMASIGTHKQGEIDPPDLDSSSVTNFKHVICAGDNLEVVGVRAPAYTSGKELREYWCSLLDIIRKSRNKRILFLGDFNCDPCKPTTPGGKALSNLRAEGWNVPDPEGEWSYTSWDGQKSSSIDHVVASPSVGKIQARYIKYINSCIVAGRAVKKLIRIEISTSYHLLSVSQCL